VAGWYLIAEPDRHFEVRISPLAGENSVTRTSSVADMLIVSVFVDGVEASPGGHAYTVGALGYEYVSAALPQLYHPCVETLRKTLF
jgi:hypothetical protein